jgi:hypothetical protein
VHHPPSLSHTKSYIHTHTSHTQHQDNGLNASLVERLEVVWETLGATIQHRTCMMRKYQETKRELRLVYALPAWEKAANMSESCLCVLVAGVLGSVLL